MLMNEKEKAKLMRFYFASISLKETNIPNGINFSKLWFVKQFILYVFFFKCNIIET